MLPLLIYLTPFFLGIFVLIAAIVVYTNFRRSRQAPYFRIRRDANNRAWRWLLAIVVSVAGIFAALRIRQFVTPPDLDTLFSQQSEATPSGSEQPLLASAIPSGEQPTVDETEDPPTITPTLSEQTPTPTSVIATLPSDVTPVPEATLTITAISSGISTNIAPVNPGTSFPEGITRLYFWLEYNNLTDGLSWSRVLLLNGETVRTETEIWDQGDTGEAYYWFEAQGGWPAGQYEIRFYLGAELMTSQTFEIIN